MQNMFIRQSIILRTTIGVLLILFLGLSAFPQNGLNVSARLIVKRGDLQGSKVTVTQVGNVIQTIPVSNIGHFRFYTRIQFRVYHCF
jgi:hypothetical protein